LEALAVRLAVDRIDDQTLEQMEQCLRNLEKVVEEKDLVAYSRLDFDFHAYLYGSCGNKVLQEVLEHMRNKSRPIHMIITPILPQLYLDHVTILAALKERNKDKAERAIREHMHHVLQRIEDDTKRGDRPNSREDLVNEGR